MWRTTVRVADGASSLNEVLVLALLSFAHITFFPGPSPFRYVTARLELLATTIGNHDRNIWIRRRKLPAPVFLCGPYPTGRWCADVSVFTENLSWILLFVWCGVEQESLWERNDFFCRWEAMEMVRLRQLNVQWAPTWLIQINTCACSFTSTNWNGSE